MAMRAVRVRPKTNWLEDRKGHWSLHHHLVEVYLNK